MSRGCGICSAAAVYERADTGLLAGVRMYDDIEHPLRQN
jgi:hypothetical protein